MAKHTRKVHSAGRFGARYGKKVRERIAKVESRQKIKQICPFCSHKGIKRKSKGIWQCPACRKTFTGGTYTV